MPRSPILNLLQSNRFWLVDVVPSATFPFYVLGAPLMGFQTISSPEITLEVDELKEMNSMYKRAVYTGGGVGPITLTRGCRAYDDTFYHWIQTAIRGVNSNPRDMLLIQYTGISISAYTGEPIDLPVAFEEWETAQFVPGRAWLLWECVPTRYKAASDFDASTGEVSIMDLDVQPRAVTEFALMSFV